MKLTILLGLLVCLGGMYGCVPDMVGRYQLAPSNSTGTERMWVIDTVNGDTWVRSAADEKWRSGGNPTK